MGNELSCPCTNDYDYDNTKERKKDIDIIDEVMKGKLTQEDLLYEYKCSNQLLTTKICLTSSKNLESFFLNRNLLIVETKLEINLYYQNVFISNFINFDSLVTIILQYKKNENEKVILMNNIMSPSKKGYKSNDYNAIYKVDSINFVSNDFDKIKEQILNDLNSQLKKEYRFYGIITDLNETKENNSSSNNSYNNKNYKILYKKSKLTDNLDIKYSVEILNDRLNSDNITNLLLRNKDKTLKGVIRENLNNKKYNYCYYFIFEGNKVTPEYDESEFLVVKMDKEKTTTDGFLKDIAEKINGQNDAFLLCVINDVNGFFLIFKIDFSGDDFDDDTNF